MAEAASKTTLPDHDPSCYLCPGNRRAQGDINPKYESTFIFVNDYSAVKEEQAEYKLQDQDGSLSALFLRAESVTAPNAQYRYMQIFENKGAAMGCSNPHPHGQVWVTTGLPEEPALELTQLQKYRREQGGANMLEDYATLEASKQERVVYENAYFLAVCPWWATWPFEVMVVSKQHKRALVDFGAEEREALAECLAEVTRRYDNLFETHFPYSMGLHQAPLEGTKEEIEASHFHIHFYPPLLRSATVRKFLVGYEMMAEPQRDITPEQAAARLRNCGGELYRKKLE
ncbi:galactose-1-phosphate uridyl transferase [Coniosporium tulheliwenetii]|uniref:Galactose-1-phosphate uridyl transferase n=1 Tax=Coniosporium tulheliwenetii TaxID=3383036 RepID=A0ACC2YKZ2_9PEZI|nr:galactose-1-phosphate uridyl transferase [Cladosporium sp. JES 115]